MRKVARDFKGFISRGNVLSLAVGVMIGGAFGKIVSSLVSDIFMPLIGLITGGLDFSSLFIALDGNHYQRLQDAVESGAATLNYGAFLTSILDFFLIALCIFMVVRLVERVMPQKQTPPEESKRKCGYCMLEIDEKATRCPHCTSHLKEEANEEAAL